MGRKAGEEPEGRRTVGKTMRRGSGMWAMGRGLISAHISLQAPLKAAHQGFESSVGVIRGSVNFWGRGRMTG